MGADTTLTSEEHYHVEIMTLVTMTAAMIPVLNLPMFSSLPAMRDCVEQCL